MRRLTCFLTLGLACAALTTAAQAGRATSVNDSSHSVTCNGAISWTRASRVIGRYATIRGPVVGTKYASYSNGSPTFLNIGVDYPSPRRFTIVIWGENRARFGTPERRYRRHTVCVRGYVRTYAGVPEIEATSPSQISVDR